MEIVVTVVTVFRDMALELLTRVAEDLTLDNVGDLRAEEFGSRAEEKGLVDGVPDLRLVGERPPGALELESGPGVEP